MARDDSDGADGPGGAAPSPHTALHNPTCHRQGQGSGRHNTRQHNQMNTGTLRGSRDRSSAKEPPPKPVVFQLRLDTGRSPENQRHRRPRPRPAARPLPAATPAAPGDRSRPAAGARPTRTGTDRAGPGRTGEARAPLPPLPRGSSGARPGRGPTRPPRAPRPRRPPRAAEAPLVPAEPGAVLGPGPR